MPYTRHLRFNACTSNVGPYRLRQHNNWHQFFLPFFKSSTVSIVSMFLVHFSSFFFFLKGTLPESFPVLVSRIAYFQVRPMVHSIFNFLMSLGKKITEMLSRSLFRGLDTLNVKNASVPVPAFTSNKHARRREK